MPTTHPNTRSEPSKKQFRHFMSRMQAYLRLRHSVQATPSETEQQQRSSSSLSYHVEKEAKNAKIAMMKTAPALTCPTLLHFDWRIRQQQPPGGMQAQHTTLDTIPHNMHAHIPAYNLRGKKKKKKKKTCSSTPRCASNAKLRVADVPSRTNWGR